MAIFAIACGVAIVAGMLVGTERFLTPERGSGYALGIIGGSAMLLLLVYPARKRLPWLSAIGSVRGWFQFHMALGLFGPLLVLFHCNFSLGAANSNVALICMLIVSASGLVGRFFYSRIHLEFYGRKATLDDLRDSAAKLQQLPTLPLLAELLAPLEAVEREILGAGSRLPLPLRPAAVWWHRWNGRAALHRRLAVAVRRDAVARGLNAAQRRQVEQKGREYVDHRLEAARRVAQFEGYEQLFALWHVLHLPLFILLLIAGIVHVVSVHVY
jgi:hypothetical protein